MSVTILWRNLEKKDSVTNCEPTIIRIGWIIDFGLRCEPTILRIWRIGIWRSVDLLFSDKFGETKIEDLDTSSEI